MKEKIIQRWDKYIEYLFCDEKGQLAIPRNIEGPEILKYEEKSVLTKLNKNKEAGPDEILNKLLTILDNFSKSKLQT